MSQSSRREECEHLLSVMKQIWPKSIGAFVPLKIGIRHDILTEFPDLDSRLLGIVLSYHTGSLRYQLALAKPRALRHNLAGEPIEQVDGQARARAKQRKKLIYRTIMEKKI